MANPTIETITACLAAGYKQLERGSFQESSEIMNDRRVDPSLRDRWFYTANLPLFRLDGSALEYGLSGSQTFDAVAGEDIERFTKEIRENDVYRLTQPQIAVLATLDGDILWQRASDIKLKKENDEWSYFTINTSDLSGAELTDARKPFAEKAYGSMKSKASEEQKLPDYGENMRMLKDAGITETRIWMPTTTHIKGCLKPGEVVARASYLGSFSGNSNFSANSRDVDDNNGLRGVRQAVVAEGDAQKVIVYTPKDISSALASLKFEGLESQLLAELSKRK